MRATTLLLLSVVFPQVACAPRTRAGATAAVLGGGALAVTGGVMLSNMTDGDDTAFSSEADWDCALGGCLLSTGMLIGGIVLVMSGLVGGFAATEDETGARPPFQPAAAPGAPPPEVATVDIRIAMPLPELPCDEPTLRMAQQARALARAGHCESVALVVAEIHARDLRYAEALVDSPALARCPRPATP